MQSWGWEDMAYNKPSPFGADPNSPVLRSFSHNGITVESEYYQDYYQYERRDISTTSFYQSNLIS